MRDKGPPLQHVRPTQIFLAWYAIGDVSEGGVISGLYMPKEGSDGMEYGPERLNSIYGV